MHLDLINDNKSLIRSFYIISLDFMSEGYFLVISMIFQVARDLHFMYISLTCKLGNIRNSPMARGVLLQVSDADKLLVTQSVGKGPGIKGGQFCLFSSVCVRRLLPSPTCSPPIVVNCFNLYPSYGKKEEENIIYLFCVSTFSIAPFS